MVGKYEVVISGMSGQFPECENVEEFKEKLFEKENLITVDNRKWPVGYTYKGGKETVPSGTGKMKDVSRLDTMVFQINNILINSYDVINRIVLEPAFEAVVDAGINPSSLSGSFIGVYAAFMTSEGEAIKASIRHVKGSMFLIGSSKTMVANRISFAFNITGPSLTYASSYQGGLEALSTAYRNISDGIVEGAIVVASNSIVDPKLSIHYQQFGFLSPDGLCRAFDENGNGYGRSDAVVALFLQRSDLAKRIYGTLLYSDYIYLGTNDHTYLSFDEELIKRSLKEIYSVCKIKPSQLSFIEMHGCGVPWMDCAESNAVADIFCQNSETPLLVGSVKSNTGHTEGTSALVSIVKALIALDSDCIPPNINFNKPNMKIKAFAEGKLKVVSEKTKLPGPIIGVNSIGITGVVSHCILQQNANARNEEEGSEDNLPRLLLIFGRTEEGVNKAITKAESMPVDKSFIALANDVFTVPMYSQLYRGYTILPAVPKTMNGVDLARSKRPIWFLFSGMGSQWNGMGQDLLKIPLFSAAIDKIDAVMRPRNVDIREILTSNDPSLFDNITNCFVGITAIQVGLVDVLYAMGIKPDGIIGHSVGETACAYADGCFTAEQAVLSAYSRGLASLEKKTIRGLMAAIGKGYEQIKDSLTGSIDVACHNSSENCTISGPADEVEDFVKKLKSEGTFAKPVNTANIAYHSKHIAPAGPLLLEKLKQVVTECKARSSIWISTSVPESEWNTSRAKYSSAEYHANNFLNPVLFQEGCKHIPDDAIVIEVAPHGLLQAIVKRSLNSQCVNIPLCIRSVPGSGVTNLLTAIGKLYLAGCQPNINALYPTVEYPVPRGTPSLAPFVSWNHYDKWNIVDPLLDVPISQELVEIRLNKGTQFNYLSSHKIKGQCVIPPSLYMYLAWQTLSILKNEKVGSLSIVFENIKVHENLTISLEKYRPLSIMIQHGSGNFEVLLEDEDPQLAVVLLTGTIQIPYNKLKINANYQPISYEKYNVTESGFYEALKSIGYEVDGIFKNVEQVSFDSAECYASITWNNNWVVFLDSLMKICIFTESNDKSHIMFADRILRLTICVDDFKLLKPGDKIICQSDRVTKRVCCNGLEMTGFKFKALDMDLSDNTNMQIKQLQFVPYLNPCMRDQQSFLIFCLHLIMENALLSCSTRRKVHIAETANSDLIFTIKKITAHSDYLKPAFVYYKCQELIPSKPPNIENYHLIAVNIGNIASVENCKCDNLFVLTKIPCNYPDSYDFGLTSFAVITKQKFTNAATIVLLKKTSKNNGCRRIIMADNKWKEKVVESRLNANSMEPVTLVWEKNQQADLSVLLLKAAKNLPNIRSMFILDEKAAPFSPDNPVYKEQLIQGLPVAVLKDGCWGSYRSETNTGQKSSKLNSELLPHGIKLRSVNIQYVSLDNECTITNENQELQYGLEYSGTMECGIRVMGLTCVQSSDKSVAQVDKYFTWTVPDNWSLEDAATVPYAYIQAYNALFRVTVWKDPKSALIHCGDTVFGEACIRLLLHHKYRVFTTVSDEHNASVLKKKFTLLSDDNIFLNSDGSYEIKLKCLTNGEGVGTVVNVLPGLEHINASVNCVSYFGNYVEFGDNNSQSDLDFGLHPCLKSVSLCTVRNKISSLLNLSVSSKEELSSLLKEGIECGLVQPFDRQVYLHNELKKLDLNISRGKKKLLLHFLDADDANCTNAPLFHFDPNHSYIIIVGSKKTVLWFELIEWLIQYGAAKFLIALENFSVGGKLSHRISRLIAQKKVTIVLTSTQKTDTLHEATKLFADANKMAPLEAVFFVSDCAESRIHNMDIASRSGRPCHFICLMSGGLNICERRRNAGLSSIVINTFEKSVNKLSSVLPHLEIILSQNSNENSSVLFDFINSQTTSKNSNSIVFGNFIPGSYEFLDNVGDQILDVPYFKETTSLCRRYSETKGVFPIFVIPGISEKQLHPLTKRLFYPTFFAILPEDFDMCDDIVLQLTQMVQQIQPEGPVTLIGECWSGCIAIALASKLRSVGRRIKIFLIEGSPSMWQNAVKDIAEIGTSQFNKNLLNQIFSFNSTLNFQNLNSSDDSLFNWDELLEKYLENIVEEKMKKNIRKATNSLRNRLVTVAKYAPSGDQLEHVVHFKQRNTVAHNPLLEQYCLADDVHLYDEEKYQDFITNPHISYFINDNALPSWCFKEV